MDNKFGKISRISACAALKDGRTILEDLSFTAPYKIMMPFEKENGGIQIMPLCASAGIMAGDSQEFSYHVKEGADLEVLSQSFEKIHKMDEGSAARTIEVQVDGGRGDPSRPGDTVNGCPFVALFQENTSGCLQNLFPDIALHASPPPFKFNCRF